MKVLTNKNDFNRCLYHNINKLLCIKGDEMWKWIDGTKFGYNNWASAEQVFFDICILIQTIFYNNTISWK